MADLTFIYDPLFFCFFSFFQGEHQSSTGKSKCDKCPANTKSENASSDKCVSCGIGTKSEPGSAKCQKCDAGEAGIGTDGACEQCQAGQFRTSIMSATSCETCPLGYSSGEGSTKCQICEAGKYGDEDGKECKSCREGQARSEEGLDATKCIPCDLGSTSKEGASCSGCDLGKYGSSKGKCSTCPAGQYQDGRGETSCKKCDKDTYLSEQGKSSKADCTSCTLDRSTGVTTGNVVSSACLCKRKEFYQNKMNECELCPRGGNCSAHDGLSIEHLHANTGYWQLQNTTNTFIPCSAAFTDKRLADAASLRCCPDEAQCHVVPRRSSWTPNDQCQKSYAGDLCTSCATNYVLFQGECIQCEGGSELTLGIVGLFCCSAVIFIATLILLKKIKVNVIVSENETLSDRLLGLISILISWLQILSSLTITYKLSWPGSFTTYSQGTGVAANLELMNLLTFSNCHFAVPFINKFILQVMGPPLFVSSIFFAWLLFSCMSKTKDKRLQKARKGQAIQLCVLIIQLLYPKLSTFTFQMFRCIDLNSISHGQLGLLLDADLKHSCYEGIHQEYMPLAFLSVVVFLIGIPLVTFLMLFRNRHRLNDASVKAELGDLFMKYEDRWYFWESVLMLQKCLLTGAMCAIAPGSPIQLVVALLGCAAYLLVS